MTYTRIIIFLAVTFSLAAGLAFAGSASVPVPVMAEIIGDCTVSTSNVGFNYISGGGEVAVMTTLKVNCTNSLSYNIEMDEGLYNNGSSRGMADVSNQHNGSRLGYDLYHADCATPWYANEQGQSGTGNGQDQTYDVCGKIFSSQEVPQGTYQDTIIVHVMLE